MAIIWIDIWDFQNGTKAKSIINRCFNFGRYITTIRGTNMNLGVPVINCLLEPKIVQLEGWEKRELFLDGLDKGF